MKKLITLSLIAIFMLAFKGSGHAQELVLNGDLELWDNNNFPTSWTKAENISQGEEVVHGGTFAAEHTSSVDGTQDFQQEITGIVGGTTYTITYWFHDNSTSARTRIWSYWLDGTNTLDDNPDELRPGTYSENNPDWQQYSVSLTAPAAANGFRFEVRVYGEDGNFDGTVYYDDFSVEGAGIQPEPTNYPADFAAQASGISVNLSWTDATGDQLPNGYLVKVATFAKITPPEDGIPVADDLDLSDGEGALNIAYGEEMCTFGSLQGNTQYFFVIFPYTNGAADIDYKTDGIPPQVSATTEDINVLLYQDFNDGFGDWQTISVIGEQVWEIDEIHGVDDTPCAKMNGYSGGAMENEDWLISPPVDMTEYAAITLSFMTAMNFSGPELEILASTDYDGGGNPAAASWETLGGNLSSGSYEWTPSGDVDLSSMISASTYIAFKYTSTSSNASTWEVDNVMAIAGSAKPEPTNYPEDFDALAAGTTINLQWTDATGEQLPSAYLILGSSESSFTPPVDGTPVGNDPDLTDGSAALNIIYGEESCEFSGLGINETYYFTIYPYTNAGVNIDYKTDGTAPLTFAITADIVVIEEQNFDNGWGGWTFYSVDGQQEWELDNIHGINGSTCAKCTGWDGSQSNENEDWLFSPALNLDNFEDEILTFFTADAYDGPPLEVLISNNYTGGDPGNATWTNLEFETSSGYFEWISSGQIDLSGIEGNNVHIGFKYTSTNAESSTWEIDDFKLTGVGEIGLDEQHAFSSAINIYPNPATEKINIHSNTLEEIKVSIYSVSGMLMNSQESFKGHTSIDISQLSKGIYIMHYTDSKGNTKTDKLVIE